MKNNDYDLAWLRGTTTPTEQFVPGDCERLADLSMRVYMLEYKLWHDRASREDAEAEAERPCGKDDALSEFSPRHLVWNKVASFLFEKHTSPVDFIARQFDEWKRGSRPPFPDDLLSPAAWKRYELSKVHKGLRLWKALQSETENFRQLVVEVTHRFRLISSDASTREERWLYALYEDDDQMSPLFKHYTAISVAAEEGPLVAQFRRCAQQHEETARVEYIRFRAEYDTEWEILIPDGFPSQAEHTYLASLQELPSPSDLHTAEANFSIGV